MNKAITLTKLRPVAEIFPWSQAREVMARMEQAAHFGKLVLKVD
jgi:NADPH:quinone reductase-like Zn-dependent oxidoreductase